MKDKKVVNYFRVQYACQRPLSFRTERSVVKNLEDILVDMFVYVPEILRFALDDITMGVEKYILFFFIISQNISPFLFVSMI